MAGRRPAAHPAAHAAVQRGRDPVQPHGAHPRPPRGGHGAAGRPQFACRAAAGVLICCNLSRTRVQCQYGSPCFHSSMCYDANPIGCARPPLQASPSEASGPDEQAQLVQEQHRCVHLATCNPALTCAGQGRNYTIVQASQSHTAHACHGAGCRKSLSGKAKSGSCGRTRTSGGGTTTSPSCSRCCGRSPRRGSCSHSLTGLSSHNDFNVTQSYSRACQRSSEVLMNGAP